MNVAFLEQPPQVRFDGIDADLQRAGHGCRFPALTQQSRDGDLLSAQPEPVFHDGPIDVGRGIIVVQDVGQ